MSTKKNEVSILIQDNYWKLPKKSIQFYCRSWCPDRVIYQSRKYIAHSIGPKYAEPVIMNYETIFEESRPNTPLICFLSMGSDPTPNIEILAKRNMFSCRSISMGQGQEVHARKLLAKTMAEVSKFLKVAKSHLILFS